MHLLGRDEFLKQGMLCPGRDGNIATVGKRNHPQRIFQPLTCSHVSGDHGDGAHIEFGRIKRQHQRQGVIASGVGVEDDLLGSRIGRERVYQPDQDQRCNRRKPKTEVLQSFQNCFSP